MNSGNSIFCYSSSDYDRSNEAMDDGSPVIVEDISNSPIDIGVLVNDDDDISTPDNKVEVVPYVTYENDSFHHIFDEKISFSK